MNNNVYIRSHNSIKTISLSRILLILPMIIYGIYKNGIYLYKEGFVNIFNMFRPCILIIVGAIIGILVNLIYEKLIKKNPGTLIETIFSSFHLEYGILLACISSINTNIFIYSICAFVIFLLSKFLKNRINTIAITFIFIYSISILLGTYEFANPYELSKVFSLNIFDYFIGRGVGGIASTHILFLSIALIILHLINSNKTEITIYSILAYSIPAIIYGFATNSSILQALFLYNYIFIFSFVATDSVTSCYTTYGKFFYGLLIGLLTFGLKFLNPTLAPFIAIVLVSLLNNLIDRKSMKLNMKINEKED